MLLTISQLMETQSIIFSTYQTKEEAVWLTFLDQGRGTSLLDATTVGPLISHMLPPLQVRATVEGIASFHRFQAFRSLPSSQISYQPASNEFFSD